MNLNEAFRQETGYDMSIWDSWKMYIDLWKSWYQGKVKEFHSYTVYNGIKDVKRERLSLQLGKFISEKMSDLLYNEHVKINLGDVESTNKLKEILDYNNFRILMNRGIEKSFAFGTGCVLINLDNIEVNNTNEIDYSKSKIKISFVPAECIFPLSWDCTGIKELAIVEFAKEPNGKALCTISTHKLNSLGNYEISNCKFKISDKGELLDDNNIYIKKIDTKSDIKWFTLLQPNICNNIDINSPFGISIFANSIDVLKGIDFIYDNLINELQLGRKRLFTTKELLRFNTTTGTQELNFDPNDIVFHVLGDGFGSDDKPKDYIQEINGQLRIDEHIKALNSALRLLGDKTGFGSDYFAFKEKQFAPKTATEVIAENTELFRTVQKHEQVLEQNLKDIIKAIAYIGRFTNTYNINDTNITIDFDDSIVESKSQERNEDRQDLAQDVMSRVDYIVKWHNVDRLTAISKIDEIDNEKPANEGIYFNQGDSD